MAYIDPDGMFGGDRMAALTDGARYAWPWFWCSANTVGRMPISYRGFLQGAFRQFQKPPTEEQFWAWVTQYHEHHLMFVYEVNGQIWGQWNVSEKYLPTYKRSADEKTPAPNARVFLAWQDEYLEHKRASFSAKCPIINNSKTFRKFSEPSGNFPDPGKFSLGEERKGEERSIKPLSPTDVGGVTEEHGPSWFKEQHDRWYKEYWNHKAKAVSLRAFTKRVRAIAKANGGNLGTAAEKLFDLMRKDREKFETTADWDWRRNLHPATWLNGERWTDEPNGSTPATTVPRKPARDMKANVTELFRQDIEKGLLQG